MGTAQRCSLDQKAMLVHMASRLGTWLLAGAAGRVSVAGLVHGTDAAFMPVNTRSLHNIVLGAEC